MLEERLRKLRIAQLGPLEDRPVGLGVVWELWGVICDPRNQFDHGVIATTSRLSPDALGAISSTYWCLSALDR